MLLTLLSSRSTSFPSFPSFLHPFLPPFISWAIEITCPLARAHHQFHDSLRVATVMAASLIESRACPHLCLCLDTVICGRDDFQMKGLFFNLLQLRCLPTLCWPPSYLPFNSQPNSCTFQGANVVFLTLTPLFSFFFH